MNDTENLGGKSTSSNMIECETGSTVDTDGLTSREITILYSSARNLSSVAALSTVDSEPACWVHCRQPKKKMVKKKTFCNDLAQSRHNQWRICMRKYRQ